MGGVATTGDVVAVVVAGQADFVAGQRLGASLTLKAILAGDGVAAVGCALLAGMSRPVRLSGSVLQRVQGQRMLCLYWATT